MKSKIWNHILPHLGHLPLALIDSEHLRAWLATLRDKKLAESTIEVIWIHLTTILKTAVGKRIVKNPCTEMSDERPNGAGDTKARAWTADQVRGLRAALPDRYQAAVDLGVMAGLRQGEAFAFSPDDIDEEAGFLHIRRQLQWDPSKPYLKLPKGNKERDIPLSPGLLKALRAHIDVHPPTLRTLPWRGPGNGERATATVSLLLTSAFGNPIHSSGNTGFNELIWKRALVSIGLIKPRDDVEGWEPSRELMFHRCRHTYASVQLGYREDPVSLSHWMGHASPDVTFKTYAHFMPDQGSAAVRRWTPGLRLEDGRPPGTLDLKWISTYAL